MSYQKAYSQSIAKPRHQACIIYSDSFIRVPIWVLDGSGCTVAFMLIGDHLPIPPAGWALNMYFGLFNRTQVTLYCYLLCATCSLLIYFID